MILVDSNIDNSMAFELSVLQITELSKLMKQGLNIVGNDIDSVVSAISTVEVRIGDVTIIEFKGFNISGYAAIIADRGIVETKLYGYMQSHSGMICLDKIFPNELLYTSFELEVDDDSEEENDY